MNALIKFHKGMFRYPTPVLVRLMALNGTSLVIDIRGGIRYLKGDRKEVVEGL